MHREHLGSRLGFILLSAGCAIGIGNVWKFPWMTGQYGGGAFVVIYLLFLLILGVPVLTMEFAMGRAAQKSPLKMYQALKPGGHWGWHGYVCLLGNVVLMMFYTTVAGWMLQYFVDTAAGRFVGLDVSGVETAFGNMLANPVRQTVYMGVIVISGFFIISIGVQKGLERVTKWMMMALIVLMLALAVHSLFLPGGSEGLKFYLLPDIQRLKDAGVGNVIVGAMNQSFFTLSLGIAAMEIFGSYMSKDNTLAGEGVRICALDTFVAIMAGLIIFPACFSFGVQPDAGPSLLFITLPNVFQHMVGGRIWGCCFFVFMSFAALSTVIAVFENIITMTVELGSWTRKKSLLVNLVLIFVLSLPAILGFNLLSGFQPFGDGSSVMDLEDFLVSYNILPLGSLIYVLFCVRKNGWGWEKFLAEVNEGTGTKLPAWLRGYMAYVVPTLICLIYLKGYYDMFAGKGTGVLLGWMAFAVLLLAVIFWVCFSVGKKPAVKAEAEIE